MMARNRPDRRLTGAIALGALLMASPPLLAAQTSPSQVTPRSIVPPPAPDTTSPLPVPDAAAPEMPLPSTADLPVDLNGVRLEGGFPELARANADFVAHVGHGRSTAGALLTAAHGLERAYARCALRLTGSA